MSQQPKTTPPKRDIPSVDSLVRELDVRDLPRPVVVQLVRRQMQALRADPGDVARAIQKVREAVDLLRLSRIQPVINATGIVIHTNLGRAPLGDEVVASLTAAASHFSNLEYDLQAGERGQRGSYVEHNLAILCGAASAAVVNNCAAALVLVLHHFASRAPRNQVIVSRGELVQIGGGFRIPDILESSGAVLREVGTTNKTTAGDYRRAIGSETALILKVHHSNFYMGGFVESPTTEQIAMIAREANVPFLEDLGSGATFDTTTLGGPEREPTPAQAVTAGADLVCFSGDKLLGGPQAGIIAGGLEWVTALKANPFYRAVRCDKLILAALQTTVDLLLSNQMAKIPVRAMMNANPDQLRTRAAALVAALADLPVKFEVGTGESQIGGGSLPRTILQSITLETSDKRAAQLNRLLRTGQTPVIAFIQKNHLKLDLRTVFPKQDPQLISAIRSGIALLS